MKISLLSKKLFLIKAMLSFTIYFSVLKRLPIALNLVTLAKISPTFPLHVFSGSKFQVIEIPYFFTGNSLSMIFRIPRQTGYIVSWHFLFNFPTFFFRTGHLSILHQFSWKCNYFQLRRTKLFRHSRKLHILLIL